VESGAVASGAKVFADEKEVGEMTSVASLPGELDGSESGRNLALGYIRREAGTPGREVRIGEAVAKVVKLPFAEFL
jgi:glycine cleavage system aminomethyltransferase T